MIVLAETSGPSVASSGSRYSQGAVTAGAPSSHRHQLVDVRPAHDTTARLEILDHRDEPLPQRHGDAEGPGLGHGRTEQRADLGLASPHHQITPDAGLGLRVTAVVRGNDGDRSW